MTDSVVVNVSLSAATPTVEGFGTPLVMAQDTPAGWGADLVRAYTSQDGMVTDGFAVTHPAYIAVGVAFEQSPAPPEVKVGKRANKTTQAIHLTILTAIALDVVELTVDGADISYTVPSSGSPTTSTVATAVAALIDALPNVAATATGAVIACTATTGAGTLIRYQDWTSNILLTDVSADPGIAADLAAVNLFDSDWYGLTLDSPSKAEILAAAPFAEANKRLMLQQTSDGDCENPSVTTDVMSEVVASSYRYTGVIYNRNDTQAFAGLALQAKRFAQTPTPGSDTYAANNLAGVKADNLPEGAIDAIETKKGMTYFSDDGLVCTHAGEGGNVGSGDWLDNVRFVDWLAVNMRADVKSALYTSANTGTKLPMTDVGLDKVGSLVRNRLQMGVDAGGLADGSITVTVPKAASIDPVTKGKRRVTGISWSAELANAIQGAAIGGTLTN